MPVRQATLLGNTGARPCLLLPVASIQPRPLKDGRTAYRVMFRVDGRQESETFIGDPKAAEQFRRQVERVGAAATRTRDARDARDARDQRNADSPPLFKQWLDKHLQMATGITDGTREEYRRLGVVPMDVVDA